MGIAQPSINIIEDLKKYGINAQIFGNKLVIIFPKSALEQKIKEEMNVRIPDEFKSRISVQALGDVIIEVLL